MGKQTRRSVSMNGEVYRQLRSLCDKHEVAASHIVQQLVECFLDLVKDKENLGDTDDEARRADEEDVEEAVRKARRKFSWTTTAEPAQKKPITGGGVHTL